MSRIAFIANARSHLVTRRGSRLKDITRKRPDIPLVWFQSMSIMDAQVGDLLNTGCDTFIIEGGDGTVLAVLTSCLKHDPHAFNRLSFAILAGGSTNLAHEKLGLKRATRERILAIIRSIEAEAKPASETVSNPALVIERHDTSDMQVGFLFSTGSLALGMDHVQHNMFGDRSRGPVAIARALLKLASRPRRYKAADGQPLLRPTRLEIHDQDGTALAGDHAFSLASTLPSLSLGISPFWGHAHAPIRFTYAPWPPRKLRRAILGATTGTGLKMLERTGYRSFNSETLELRSDAPAMLDGELLHIEPGTPVSIGTTDPIRFLR